jgi:hypothetical protein
MAWFATKDAPLEELIARKKFGKAIELLRGQFKQGSRDPRMRLQLADVLIMAGKGVEATPILIGLADEYARDGFAAKAIALLKKIERVQPGRADVEKKLASLIHQERSRAGTAAMNIAVTAAEAMPEIGMEEMASESAEATASEDAPMTEQEFDLELTEITQETLEAAAAPSHDAPATAASAAVASPLFSDFAADELLDVMRGLRLLSFEPGDIIITEGEPGDSLFVLSTGLVKAFVRNPAGRHVQVREMGEGSFFGEISVLSGKPRTATVTAAGRCELLELDRTTLDGIASRHPRVMQVLQEFSAQRAGSKDEEMVRRMSFGRSS